MRLTNADVDGVKADVSLKAELKAAADATIARYGKVHILVNNAGSVAAGLRCLDRSAWDWTLGVNLMAVVWGIEIFGPLIEQHGEGGHIVSTASIAGLSFWWCQPVQCQQVWRCRALGGSAGRLAPRGIGVSVLCPGFIRTRSWICSATCPERFDRAAIARRASGYAAKDRVNQFRERVSQGIDPSYVGELVREGIEDDWPYIFTDLEFEPQIEARFAAIKQGFDHFAVVIHDVEPAIVGSYWRLHDHLP